MLKGLTRYLKNKIFGCSSYLSNTEHAGDRHVNANKAVHRSRFIVLDGEPFTAKVLAIGSYEDKPFVRFAALDANYQVISDVLIPLEDIETVALRLMEKLEELTQ